MGKLVDICGVIEVLPDSEVEVSIYEVPGARKLKVNYVKLFFPVGTNFELAVKVKYGTKEVRPTHGEYRGDGNYIVSNTDEIFYAGDRIVLLLKNESATETKRVLYHLEGILE